MRRLVDFTASKPFLVCIDSDGCAFDTMEIKHKECFCPAYIEHFSLQPVSKYAREAWEYANLYSTMRGMHRFITLLASLELLAARREVRERGFTAPDPAPLRRWIEDTERLSNAHLALACAGTCDGSLLRRALAWSQDVNERVGRLVHGIPPFPHVRECLRALNPDADVVILSATQEAALAREWGENDLSDLVDCLCGQESGGKSEIIARLAPHYAPGHALMIGDAPGDAQAARENGISFFPICPGEESESWRTFSGMIDVFLSERYDAPREREAIAHFERLLPSTPPWA